MKNDDWKPDQLEIPQRKTSEPKIALRLEIRRLQWISILCAILFAPAGPLQSDTVVDKGVVFTSIVRLLAHPEKYQDKEVEVIGYYKSGQELHAIFTSAEDARHGNTQAAIWINFNGGETNKFVNKKIRSGWVEIIGTFHHTSGEGAGHMGMWPSELQKVRFFQRRK